LYGVGIGLRKRYDATNIIMLKLAETGVLGLLAFLAMHAVFFLLLFRAQRHLSRTDPLFSALTIGGALVLYKFGHGCVDHYWSRGALMCACAGAGMSLHVHMEIKRRRKAARRAAREQEQLMPKPLEGLPSSMKIALSFPGCHRRGGVERVVWECARFWPRATTT
jgi:hypothetical protein